MSTNVDASDPSVGVRRRHLPSNDAGEDKTAGDLMDRLYRRQRHVYDFTRKYYLLGRDQLIDRLAPPPGGRVLEVGCGTARNLMRAARVHPDAAFFGIDISQEMLVTARRVVVRAGLASRIRIARADATSFDLGVLFDVPGFSRIYFSYSLSMIPAWPAALEKALACLEPDGELHVVDFGNQEGLPRWFRAGLRRWLDLFHVHPCDQLEAELIPLGAVPAVERPFGGYAQYLVCRRA